jgi:hypothetical protein
MSTGQMRKAIHDVYYSGKPNKWTAKVARMSDNQVLAVYLSFKKRGLV